MRPLMRLEYEPKSCAISGNYLWLIRRFGVLTSRREKEAGQGWQQGFSSPANVVNKLEKAQIARQFFLRYASMWPKPGA
jgi:hypothetical protein